MQRIIRRAVLRAKTASFSSAASAIEGAAVARAPRRTAGLPAGEHRPRTPVFVAGSGFVPVTRKQADVSLAGMGAAAITAALADAGLAAPAPPGAPAAPAGGSSRARGAAARARGSASIGALYVGNMLSGMLSSQQHLGPLLANAAGLGLAEATTVEACCGSGGAALRLGFLAVASGAYETVVVAGVEHMTHVELARATAGLAAASHWATEGGAGETFVTLNGAIMAEYLRRYGRAHADFAPFPVTAHANALTAAHATLKLAGVTAEAYEASRLISPPIRLLDASPVCDGAAAVVLTSDAALARGAGGGARARPVVRLAGSAAATDTLAIRARPDLLALPAVARATASALAAAGVGRPDVDIFELHDAYAIMAAVCLEAAGFCAPGEATAFAADGALGLRGALPIATFGGLKARGHPVGATGVYQAAEMHRQLTGRAGDNAVPGARVAVTQNVGGAGASIYTHVFVQE